MSLMTAKGSSVGCWLFTQLILRLKSRITDLEVERDNLNYKLEERENLVPPACKAETSQSLSDDDQPEMRTRHGSIDSGSGKFSTASLDDQQDERPSVNDHEVSGIMD